MPAVDEAPLDLPTMDEVHHDDDEYHHHMYASENNLAPFEMPDPEGEYRALCGRIRKPHRNPLELPCCPECLRLRNKPCLFDGT